MSDAVSLDDIQVHYATASRDERGLRLRSTHQRYSYMALIPLTATTDAFRRYAEVEIDVLAGRLGLACCDDGGNLLQVEALVDASESTQKQVIEIPESAGPLFILLRHHDPGEETEAVVRSVSVGTWEEVDPTVIKQSQLRTLQGGYVHYEFDLGDGQLLRASRPEIMANHRLKHRIIIEQIEGNFGPLGGLRVLDAGCAGGYHALNLAAAGADVVGIDPEAGFIEQAKFALENAPQYQDVRETGRCRFEIADVVDFRTTEPFDVVLCTGVLYHLRNIIDAVNNLGALARGAVVESAVSGVTGLTQALASSQYPCFEGEQAFVPTVELIETLMRRAGFEVTTKSTGELVSAQELDQLDAIDRRFFTERYFFIARRS